MTKAQQAQLNYTSRLKLMLLESFMIRKHRIPTACTACDAKMKGITFEGEEPDACLGYLPGVTSACCGHGDAYNCHVSMMASDQVLRGETAWHKLRELGGNPAPLVQNDRIYHKHSQLNTTRTKESQSAREEALREAAIAIYGLQDVTSKEQWRYRVVICEHLMMLALGGPKAFDSEIIESDLASLQAASKED